MKRKHPKHPAIKAKRLTIFFANSEDSNYTSPGLYQPRYLIINRSDFPEEFETIRQICSKIDEAYSSAAMIYFGLNK